MTEFLEEHWVIFYGLFVWLMGYVLGYKHGRKDGEGWDR